MKYANITSTLALVVAMGGTSYAAASLAKNSVGTPQLKKNAVVSKKVKNGSLKAVDFAAGQLPKGDKGDTGNVGAATVQYTEAAADLADGTEVSIDAFCPAGQQAISGGVRGDFSNSEETIVGSSRPVISTTNTAAPVDGGTFTGWRATVFNPVGGSAGIRPEVWVVCVKAPTP